MSQINPNSIYIKLKHGGISLDILWLIIFLSGFLFFTSLIPLPPNDFWWHLKIGEYIYTNHSVPTTNMFAWTLPTNQPFFYAAWLAELLLYILYHLGGLALVTFMRTVLVGVVICLIANEAHRRSGSWRISALVVALLGFMITNNITVRPQMWAWIPFIITYITLARYTEGKLHWGWLLICPFTMIFWVNVHGSFILGLILPGAFFIGEVLKKFLTKQNSRNWKHTSWIGCVGILSALSILINPHFEGIVSYTIKLLTDPPSQQLITEWQSPVPQGLPNVTFYVSIIMFVIVLAYSKYRLSATEIILLIGFLWLAWSGQRYIIWYGMSTMPILARLIKDLPIKMPVFIPQKNWINLAIAVIVFIPTLAVQPWFVERMPLPETYWEQVLKGSPVGALLMPSTPVAAVQYLKSHPGGHLFNEMGYGSYLIWAMPEQGVFIDTRVELFPYDQWMDYIRINHGTNYEIILEKYGVDRIILDKKLQPDLAMTLPEDKQWILEYDDMYSQIWSRISNP
jgi:hypothetical protein